MTQADRISELEAQIAELRRSAEQADAGLALILGMLMEGRGTKFSIDPEATLHAAKHEGWTGTLVAEIKRGISIIQTGQDERRT